MNAPFNPEPQLHASLVLHQASLGDAALAARVEAYVAAHPEGTAFHRPAWLNAVEAATGHSALALVAEVAGDMVGYLPFSLIHSPLFGRLLASSGFAVGGGVLAGKYQGGARPEGARFSSYLGLSERHQAMARRFVNDRSLASTERFMAIAAEAGMSPVTMAVAWSKQHDFVASTIVGVSAEGQLADIFAAADLVLPTDVMAAIDKVSREIRYPMG